MAKDKNKKQEGRAALELRASQGQAVPAKPARAQKVKKPRGRKRTGDDFTGRAAQLAVMAELLRRQCNAAIPEVDVGTDVFAFIDGREEVVRIQVKGCNAPHGYADGSGYSAVFALPMKQLRREDEHPPLFYALAVRRDEKWVDFLVVSRERLRSYYNGSTKFGARDRQNDALKITVKFCATVTCSGQELTDCRNAWASLPPLRPPPDLNTLPLVQWVNGNPSCSALPPLVDPGQT
jgi:hypothetical protein